MKNRLRLMMVCVLYLFVATGCVAGPAVLGGLAGSAGLETAFAVAAAATLLTAAAAFLPPGEPAEVHSRS